METYEITAPCHFGLESVLKREIYDLGYDIVQVDDGKVTFEGDAEAICRANLSLMTAERVLLQVGSFHAETFDGFFEGMKALPWERFIPEDGKFWIKKASSVRSKLFSPSDLQSVGKKAIVERLKDAYHKEWFDETGASYPIRIMIKKDEVSVGLDTSGDSLHKRGYRVLHGAAPISETLAAALILLTPWHPDRIMVDPFCGSGTFLIEAARMAAHIAPGLGRNFTAEEWTNFIPSGLWKQLREEAREEVDLSIHPDLQGYDIDPEVLSAARENARNAGVEEMIHFQCRDVKDLHHPKKYGFLLTNPPYGERMEEKKALPALYGEIGNALDRLDSWSAYIITSYTDTEKYIRRKATKKRKIYNGMIRTDFYMFPGPKPPKRKRQGEANG